MKKELLIASALVGSLGMAGVAEAASATMSGKARVGMTGSDSDGSASSTYNEHQQASFSVSLSETTDGGMKISTGFDLTDENDGATDVSGLTLTFTNGAKLDIVEAGNAYASQLASVPGASGELGVTGPSENSAPTGLTYGNQSDAVGMEFHTAADAFGVEGLKAGLSWSGADTTGGTTTHVVEGAYSVGVSYVTTTGDTTVTIGGGIIGADTSATNASIDGSDGMAVAITAATGDLTVGAGYAAGDYIVSNGLTGASAARNAAQATSVSAMSAGAKYVSGDMTFNVGYVSGESTDVALATAASGSEDSYEKVAASIDYAVAGGVTATVGYADESRSDEGTSQTANSGTSWYIGANVSF
jgi:hypothetical protein